MPLPAKNSSASTNKTPSSWASGHEVNPARQRQTEALPIGKHELSILVYMEVQVAYIGKVCYSERFGTSQSWLQGKKKKN